MSLSSGFVSQSVFQRCGIGALTVLDLPEAEGVLDILCCEGLAVVEVEAEVVVVVVALSSINFVLGTGTEFILWRGRGPEPSGVEGADMEDASVGLLGEAEMDELSGGSEPVMFSSLKLRLRLSVCESDIVASFEKIIFGRSTFS